MSARLLSHRHGRSGRALVIGAGISGLLAARVLADHFSQVEILEQDTLPSEPRQRPGVPQGHHVHGLTARGAEVMERLFPGLCGELTDAGAPGGDFGEIVAFRFPTCWSPRTPTGIPLQTFSRPLLETRLRERVLSLRNVRVRPGVRITGLTGGPGRVTGVRARGDRGAGTGAHGRHGTGAVLTADLVVDASGRNSRLPHWLTELGLPPVTSTVIDAHVGYASRLYAAPDPHTPPWAAAMEVVQAPRAGRGFMATRVENGRLLVTLQGAGGDRPPDHPDGFTAFAESLRTPLADLLARLTPLSAIRPYAHCANRRTDYHRLPVWPDGLIALGDSVCAFNPLYGQGMGVAAMEAELLQTMIGRERALPGHGFTRTYQHRVAALTRRPWIMSTVQDRGWHLGPDARSTRVTQALLTCAQQTMAADPDVFRRFLAAMHMTRSSAVLLHPRAVLALATTALRPDASLHDDTHLWWGDTPHTGRVDLANMGNPPVMTENARDDSSAPDHEEATRRYYETGDVDAFYDAVWGGEDIHVGQYADAREAIADASRRTVQRAADRVVDLLGPDATVLDLGSGYGGSARALAERFGCRVVALDLSEEHNRRHRAANARRGLDGLIEVVTGTLNHLPYEAERFDVVWSLEVLCHVTDRDQALAEAVRVLKPGGALVFSDIMAAEETPAQALRPALSRLGVDTLATPSFYLEHLAGLGLKTDFEDRSPDLATHYARLDEEVRRRAAELRGVISPAYVDDLLANLPLWTDITRRRLLRWGLFHARRTTAGPAS
ncbi:methyltransferase domain-containing protein [Streptomyces alanosinicus]|uniref:Methyltransferase type 11 domain-containing protein n=1 Tax=Streptomyces alanosinicus TaxID=68171 RepID=A0A919D592_9ACTN|nr:methyltransferase domain-containing protein [Streptomyces alanosinicus]GHE08465.1 hypothetical protein GCM10010339_57000 [Streptomyces alanosinicus]